MAATTCPEPDTIMLKLATLTLLALIGAVPAVAQIAYYEVVDVPTDLTAATWVPWSILRNDSGSYSAPVTLPNFTSVDALLRLGSGEWLLSVGEPETLGGATFDPRDLIRFDGGATYSLFLDGPAAGIPEGSDVDAVLLEASSGDPVISFDVATTIGAVTFEPADLVLYSAGTFSLFFDASVAGIPNTTNVTGAHLRGGFTVLTFDVPTTVGPATFLPGELVAWDGTNLSVLDAQAAWPANRSSRVDALSFPAAPGAVPPTIMLERLSSTELRINWSPSTCSGGEDYAIYAGTIGSWYSHTFLPGHCTDAPPLFQEDITFAAGDVYYLVVPLNTLEEGSYGSNSVPVERPVGSTTCVAEQELTCL